MADSEITKWTAIYGAVLSSLAMLWNIYRDWTDRGRLRVSCYLANVVAESGPQDERTYLVWYVVNVGRKPIVVTHIGGAYERRHFMIATGHPLPRTLQPGEYFQERSADLKNILSGDLRALWAIDSLGKHHRAPRRQVRKLKRDLRTDGA